jgi:hypothetical protein
MRWKNISLKVIAPSVAALCLIGCQPLMAQLEDTSAVMDQRMETIAGNAALNCGHVRAGENASTAFECARKAIGRRRPFLVRFDYWGTDSLLSDGFAEDGNGNVFLIRFDSLGWGGEGVLDDRHDFVEKCPKPVHIRQLPLISQRFTGMSCKRKKKNSDDRYEQ